MKSLGLECVLNALFRGSNVLWPSLKFDQKIYRVCLSSTVRLPGQFSISLFRFADEIARQESSVNKYVFVA